MKRFSILADLVLTSLSKICAIKYMVGRKEISFIQTNFLPIYILILSQPWQVKITQRNHTRRAIRVKYPGQGAPYWESERERGIKRVLEGMRKIITIKKERFRNNMSTSICAVLQTLMSRRIDFEWFLT